MAAIRQESVYAAIKRIDALTDCSILKNFTEIYVFQTLTISYDESLTIDEKYEAIKIITRDHDHSKILFNRGTKRLCENCSLECLATLYCEHCVRTYLKKKFSNWTSGNIYVDYLIRKCQIKSFRPDNIIEWIPYNDLQILNI
jgi:hypothetical protein